MKLVLRVGAGLPRVGAGRTAMLHEPLNQGPGYQGTMGPQRRRFSLVAWSPGPLAPSV